MSAQQETRRGSQARTPDSDGRLLICNVGSSSLKINCYRIGDSTPETTWVLQGDAAALETAFQETVRSLSRVTAVVHRVVHAGPVEQELCRITPALKTTIAHWLPLAPLHNRLMLDTVDLVTGKFPDALQYAAFDSGPYARLPEVARVYALPADLQSNWPLLRYGFHGLAHRSQWRQVVTPEKSRVITVQLGGGCSVTAWQDGRAVDTSMGFSPADGLIMSTRSGELDPILVLKLLGEDKYTAASLESLLQRESGLKGLSGISGDIRELLRDNTPRSRLAIDCFCYRVRKQIGAFVFALGGVDAISFGGGIGENQPAIRQQCLAGLEGLGIQLDADKNPLAAGLAAIHSRESKVELFVAPVDEMAEMLEQYYQIPRNL